MTRVFRSQIEYDRTLTIILLGVVVLLSAIMPFVHQETWVFLSFAVLNTLILAFAFLAPLSLKYVVKDGIISADFMLSRKKFRLSDIKKIEAVDSVDLVVKELGIASPGVYRGWFRDSSGQRVYVSAGSLKNVVRITLNDFSSLFISPSDREGFVLSLENVGGQFLNK